MPESDAEPVTDRGARELGVPRSVKILLAIAGIILLGIVLLDALALFGHF
jgi:hypothetical protein